MEGNSRKLHVSSNKWEIKWRNVWILSFIHAASIYGIFLLKTAHMYTILFEMFTLIVMFPGTTAGAHRLWAHRSYKAKLPLRVYLACVNLMAFQGDIWSWVRDHRVHHKFSETDADPHNATRGFFFSHMGWLLIRKHPEVKRRGKEIDLSDIEADPVVMIQKKYYLPLAMLCAFIIPTLIPLMWKESLMTSYMICLLRYTYSQHITWLVNSAAHMWGNRPYDATINPSENMLVALLAYGEGFHNYHHTFPHDYSTSEFGPFFNVTTLFINAMAKLGLAYDLRTISKKTIDARKLRTGAYSKQE